MFHSHSDSRHLHIELLHLAPISAGLMCCPASPDHTGSQQIRSPASAVWVQGQPASPRKLAPLRRIKRRQPSTPASQAPEHQRSTNPTASSRKPPALPMILHRQMGAKCWLGARNSHSHRHLEHLILPLFSSTLHLLSFPHVINYLEIWLGMIQKPSFKFISAILCEEKSTRPSASFAAQSTSSLFAQN